MVYDETENRVKFADGATESGDFYRECLKDAESMLSEG